MNKYDTDRGWVIVFSDQDRAQADEYGHMKHDKSERDGRRADWYDGTERHNHADGVAGEMAVSYFLGKPFEFRIDTFKGADVGRNYEVRTTKVSWFDLKVKERDNDKRVVIALRKLSEKAFLILGWMTVKEAKSVGEWKDPGNKDRWAYFVVPGKLHAIETLPQEQPTTTGWPR